VNDDDTGTLRQSNNKWFEAMGDDYIRKAFIRAHAADQNAILRLNEFDIERNQAKFEGVKKLLIDLKKQGAPVHALGWQMHLKPGSFDPATLLARMNEIADLGFDNYVSELDVELPENANEADFEEQKQTIKTAVESVLAARRLKSIVVWGLRDGDPDWLTEYHAELFDENLNKKPAYFGVQEALLQNQPFLLK
jgi:endo-1,4-beta-xylanase